MRHKKTKDSTVAARSRGDSANLPTLQLYRELPIGYFRDAQLPDLE